MRLQPRPRRVLKTLACAVGLALAGQLALSTPRVPTGGLQFREVPAEQSGIHWVHDNAMSPEHYLPETVGAGCAFLDFDNDGWMDVYLVNSGPCDFHKPRVPRANALYRNNGDGTFSDVTARAGVGGRTFGMGAAVGDYDNDGSPDLYVTAYGKTTLYRNNGNGTFTDATVEAGIGAQGWTTSAAFFDYDDDGWLDLFVCSYVKYGLDVATSCSDSRHGKPYYCVPRLFKPTSNSLFHNNGDGTFSEASAGTEIARALGKALGVVATDVNNDGRMDLFVSNDTVQNYLFLNRGQGRWEEKGLRAQVGFGGNGQARSGMGVDSADYDADGWQDLFVANIDQELFSLYRNGKDESFMDDAQSHGIAAASQTLSGWGLKFSDFDNDGWIDLLLANGHPDDMIDSAGGQVHYKEPLLLFHNRAGRYSNVSAEAGPIFQRELSARGLATGDFDNDGRVDVLVANNGMAPVLLRNQSEPRNHWLGVSLAGTTCNRDAVGALVSWSAGGTTRRKLKTSGGSYLSSHDPRLVLGLGTSTAVDWVEVTWPGPRRRVERFSQLAVDRYVKLVEGTGKSMEHSE
jgi:enediyne biosynthesis protein E4